MEIRGLGLINVQDLFGVASTRRRSASSWSCSSSGGIRRASTIASGIDEAHHESLGVRVPMIRMPVAPGRNLAILVEVAARNQLLRNGGLNSARRLADRLDAQLGAGARDGRSRIRRRSREGRATDGRRTSRRRATRSGRRHAARRAARTAVASRFVVLTGLSGSGKSQAIRALEDLGYFCVDNLPVALLPMLAELTLRAGNEIARAAVVVDVREGQDARRAARGVQAAARRCATCIRC